MSQPFVVVEAEQRSAEWFRARAGRVTGSVAADIVATLKSGGEPASRRDLRTRLALEKLTGQPLEDDYQNGDMRRGIELEPDAVAAFEADSGLLVQRTGFLAHTQLPIGCSLDGHFGAYDGILECKCPRSANHLKYLKGRTLPQDYKFQILHNLLVTGASFAEFCSFDPRFPAPLRLFRVRYDRNEAEVDSYLLLLKQFLRELDEEYAEIARMAMVAA